MDHVTLLRTYHLQCAHRLTAGVPERHICRRLHGHRYVLTIGITGEPGHDGMLIEYDTIDGILRPVLRAVDHHDLNTLPERRSEQAAQLVGQNPTVERLALFFAGAFADMVASARQGVPLRLTYLRLEEDAEAAVEWRARAAA